MEEQLATDAVSALSAPIRSHAVSDVDVARSSSALPIQGLTRLAALAIDAPIALVSLIPDATHQLPLGIHGLDWLLTRTLGPLQFSLCAQVAAHGLPIIVADAAADPRSGAGVRDAEVAGYAGFPLRGHDGHVVGTVCVADRRPREWEARELTIAAEFAEMISGALAGESAGLARHAQAAADTSQAFLNALLDSLDTGVAACDADGRLVLFNRALRDMLSVGPSDAPRPEDWTQRLQVRHPDGTPMPAEEMPLLRALHGEHARGVSQIIGPRDRHVLVNGHPIVGPDGHRLLGAVAAVHDMTARRQAQHLRECELKVSYALTEAPDAAAAGRAVLSIVGDTFGWAHAELWLADPAGDQLQCAASWDEPGHADSVPVPAALRSGEGLAGTVWESGEALWQPDLVNSGVMAADALQAALALPVRSGERTVGVLTFFAEVPQEPGDPMVGLLSGIAAHLGQYLERRRAEELQLALAQSKDAYIALVGHELRTPLTSVASYTELIGEHPPETPLAEVLPLIRVLQRNTTALRKIIDDLLDLAALDSGHLSLHRRTVDLTEIVQDAATAIGAAARALGLQVTLDLTERVTVNADPGRLRQVLDNLCGNAVKYSPDGGRIAISTRTDPAAGTVSVTVADSGIGVPDDERDDVFRRFHRSSRARQLGIPGTGLGLPFSRGVAERHGGTLTLAGAPGSAGTVATLTLPLRP